MGLSVEVAGLIKEANDEWKFIEFFSSDLKCSSMIINRFVR